MLGFLKRLFTNAGGSRLVVESYWCETPIKLPDKVTTELGSKVSNVKVCVDIHFSVEGELIQIQRVKMARGGGSLMGSSSSFNVSSVRTGEAWRTSHLCSESHLMAAVEQDFSSENSKLRKLMMTKWRHSNRSTLAEQLVEALNSKAPLDQLTNLIAKSSHGIEISFTYTKESGETDVRHVKVKAISGDSIQARDQKDQKMKSFRIDRITNVQRA